jgi:hypothetical protein
MEDISNRIKQKYGKLGQMYPSLGNHEGLPCDNFDYSSDKHQWILDNSTEYWKQWLTPECNIIILFSQLKQLIEKLAPILNFILERR